MRHLRYNTWIWLDRYIFSNGTKTDIGIRCRKLSLLTDVEDLFGYSVSISGDYILVVLLEEKMLLEVIHSMRWLSIYF
jgi:hypothetical protein